MKPFQFKQFAIHQDQTAMKVGTDGVLLGAWAILSNSKNILDIGTGTGLISLMLAQRKKNAQITAIEIEKNAFDQATHNFKISDWDSRIQSHHTSLQEFNSLTKFDTIISNPPFFDNQHFTQNTERTLARHTSSLSYTDLLSKTSQLLEKDGFFHTIIPYQSESIFIAIAKEKKLYPIKITHVRGNPNSPLKRSLLTFSFLYKTPLIEELVIEKERHQYTKEYQKLTKGFYLKM